MRMQYHPDSIFPVRDDWMRHFVSMMSLDLDQERLRKRAIWQHSKRFQVEGSGTEHAMLRFHEAEEFRAKGARYWVDEALMALTTDGPCKDDPTSWHGHFLLAVETWVFVKMAWPITPTAPPGPPTSKRVFGE